MSRHRFHKEGLDKSIVILDGDEAAHARRVLRLSEGDRVDLFDGAGTTAEGVVIKAKKTLEVQVEQTKTSQPLTPRIDVAAAIPKGDRADTMIEKTSELAATRFIPMLTDRSVVKPRDNKIERMRRVALESAKQCKRAWLMEIDALQTFPDVLAQPDYDLVLFTDTPTTTTDTWPTCTGVPDAALTADSILVLVGPEGGWTDQERQVAHEHNCTRWQFAANVLRVETAAIAAVSILRNACR